jgi:hypothetical protein
MNILTELDKNKTETDVKILHQRLLAPFPMSEMDVRPGATNKDKTQAIPLFYVDPRAITQRLDKVFGLGGYSISHCDIQQQLDYKESTDWETKAVKSSQGLLVSCTCTINIHTPELQKTVTNVGEKGLDETGHNKTTSAWAQAYKRAASLLGVGSYLYYLQLGYFPYDKFKKKVNVAELPDNVMIEALEQAGFNFKCEISGEPVTWKVAAASMQYFGRVLCPTEGKKLREAMGL